MRLLPSDSYSGRFPESLSVASVDGRVELYAAGAERATGGLVYSLGDGEDPEPNPTDESHCPGAEDGDFCDTLLRPTGLNQSWSPSGDVRELCFVSGFGTVEDDQGLWVRCDDGYQFTIPVPGDTVSALSARPSEDDDGPRGLSVTSNQEGEQILLAGASSLRRAWFYEPLSGDPIDVPTPDGAGDEFGATLGVLVVASGHLLAVSSPDAGQIWFYRVNAGAADPIGCLEGEVGLGQVITAGDIDGDGEEDLLVSADGRVRAYSGAALSDLSGGASLSNCAVAAESAALDLLSIECESTGDISGCGASEFGSALAIADVDGDGKGEIFVGAPRIEARGVSRSGATLAYDSEGKFTDILVVSDAKEGDELGSSLLRVPQGERDIVAAGATGSRELYLFYCAAGSDGNGSARCK